MPHNTAKSPTLSTGSKIYTYFNPDTNGKYLSEVVSSRVFRTKAEQHFLTNVLLGYVMGATTGSLMPELYKKMIPLNCVPV